MSRSDRLLKSTLLFGIGTFGSKVLVMLIVPFCTRYVDTVGMGTYDLVYTISELLKSLAVLCIPEALFRWMVDKTGGYQAMLSTWVFLYVGLIAIFSGAFWLAWFFIRFSDAAILYSMVVTGALYLGVQFGVRGVRRNKLFAIQGVLYAATMCLTSILFVVAMGLGYRGLLFGILFATVVTIAFCIMSVPEFRSVSIRFVNTRDFARMLRYSVPLIPNQMSWWCINSMSRVAITLMLGVAANGIYAVASKFPSAINMIAQIFQLAWQEQAIVEYKSDDRDLFYSRVFNQLTRLLTSALLVIAPVIAAFILGFTDPSYHDARPIALLLCFSSLFSAFSSFYGTLYMCSTHTAGAASTTLLGAGAAIALNFALVVPWGLMGIALATVASQLLVWVVRIHSTRRYAQIRIDWLRMAPLLLLALGDSFLACTLDAILPLLLLALVGCAAFVVINKGLICGLLRRIAVRNR